MLDGQLRAAGRLTDEIRLDTLLVTPAEVARLLRLGPPNGFSRSETQRRLCLNKRSLDLAAGTTPPGRGTGSA